MTSELPPSAVPEQVPLVGPVRTCVGCRERVTKRELLRVTIGPDTHGHPAVVPDPGATAPGRGAHLHPTTECLGLAVRKKALPRALRFTQGGGQGLSTAPLTEYLEQHAAQHLPHDHRPT